MNRTFLVFLQFLRRDFYTHKKKVTNYLINFGLLRPIFYAISFAYIQTNVIFGPQQKELCTLFFLGNAMLILLVLTFTLVFRIFFDMEQSRFIDYQSTILPPRILLLENVVFSTLFTFFIMIPFFPLSKLILGSYFVTTKISWVKTIWILFVGSFCLSCLHTLCICILKGSENLTSLWMRIYIPLLTVGGLWAPLHVVKTLSKSIQWIFYLNPMIYVTEGLRRAVLSSDKFLSIYTCTYALILFSIAFMLLSFYLFKRRIDHI